MAHDDLPGDRKPDTETLIVQIVFRAAPEKSFEHLISITFGNAGAIILYSDDDVVTFMGRFDGDRSARRRMLDGVVETDDENLFQMADIGINAQIVLRGMLGDAHLARFRQHPALMSRFGDDLGDGRFFRFMRIAFGFDAREIDEALKELPEFDSLTLYALQGLLQ